MSRVRTRTRPGPGSTAQAERTMVCPDRGTGEGGGSLPPAPGPSGEVPRSTAIDGSGDYARLKRSIDIVLSSVGLLASSPLMLVIAIAIKAGSPGPAIFVQWRAGRDGRPFRMYKFRTMVDGAEVERAQLAASRGLEEPVLKFHHDPRVTGVGRFLRRWSLDELPQLMNVLKGEMSMVGPRPEELRIVGMYSAWHCQRLRATPGITGPMQVSGRAGLSLDERVRVELDYIGRASLREDAIILVQTLPAILHGEGSY